MRSKITLVLFIISFSLALAEPQIIFQNEEILVGENAIGTIETVGEFTNQIEKENVIFYEGRRKVFFDFDIFNYDQTHYFYFYANRPGNFSIQIENVMFKEAGLPGMASIKKDFQIIKNDSTGILQIKPGFLNLEEVPKISLINKGNENLQISYLEEEINLRPNELKEIQINPDETFSLVQISSYKEFNIPILVKKRINDSKPLIPQKIDLKTIPEEVEITMKSENKTEFKINLINFGTDNISKLNINSTIPEIKFNEIKSLDAKTDKNLTLEIETNKEGIINGTIKLSYIQNEKEYDLEIPITLYVLSPASKIENVNNSAEKSCEDLNGTVCQITEKCEGSATFTKDGQYCCFARCIEEKVKEKSSSGWIWGVLIFIGLGFGGYYLFTKYKKTKPLTPEQNIQKITEQHSKRLSGVTQRS